MPITLVRKLRKFSKTKNNVSATLDTRRNNLVATNRILVANEGRQTSSKMRLKKKNKVRRRKLKSLRRRSHEPQKHKHKLYDQIIQSYKARENMKLKKRIKRKKKLLRKKINSKLRVKFEHRFRN